MANPWDNDPIVKPAQQPKPVSSASNWWDNDPIVGHDATAERQQDGSLSADNASRSFATGVPIIGGLLNKVDAGTNAFLAPVIDPLLPDSFQKLPGETFGERYQQALDIQQGKDQAFHAEHPYVDTGLNIAGGVAALAPVAGTAVGGRALGVTGETLAGRTLASTASGAGIGGADAAVRSGGDPMETLKGVGFGAGAGLIAPVAGAAIGAGAKRVLDWMRSPGQGVERNIASSLASDGLDQAGAQARIAELGPQGMIADLGPNAQGDLSAIASMPGRGQTVARNALADRAAGTGDRIRADADTILGQNGDVAADRAAYVQQRAEAAAPLYERAYAEPWTQTEGVDTILRTPAGRSAFRDAQRWATNEGVPLDPSRLDVRGLDLVKRSLDDQISVAQRAGRSNEARILTAMKNKVVADAPQSYRDALSAYSGPSGIIDALDNGQSVFQRGVTAGQVAAEVKGLSAGEREAYQRGTRAALEEMMINARSAPKEVLGQFQKEANQMKLAAVLGVSEAKQFLSALKREAAFADTSYAATGNSATAARQAAQQRWGGQTGDGGVIRSALNFNYGDALASAGGRLNQVQNEATMAARRGLAADILTARGSEAEKQLAALARIQRLIGQNEAIGSGIGNAAQIGATIAPNTIRQRLGGR